MTTHVTVTLIRDLQRGDPPAAQRIRADLAPSLAEADVSIHGIFTPVLGLASNELYLVTTAPEPHDVVDLGDLGLHALESHGLVPAAGPDLVPPAPDDGIVVFRWFEVKSDDVERIVELSTDAWPSFEADFDARVLALLRQPTEAPTIRMLLMTRYGSLAEWERSRKPAAPARDRFAARANLVLSTRPVATRAVA